MKISRLLIAGAIVFSLTLTESECDIAQAQAITTGFKDLAETLKDAFENNEKAITSGLETAGKYIGTIAKCLGPAAALASLIFDFLPKPDSPELIAIRELTDFIKPKTEAIFNTVQTLQNSLESVVTQAIQKDRLKKSYVDYATVLTIAPTYFRKPSDKGERDMLKEACRTANVFDSIKQAEAFVRDDENVMNFFIANADNLGRIDSYIAYFHNYIIVASVARYYCMVTSKAFVDMSAADKVDSAKTQGDQFNTVVYSIQASLASMRREKLAQFIKQNDLINIAVDRFLAEKENIKDQAKFAGALQEKLENNFKVTGAHFTVVAYDVTTGNECHALGITQVNDAYEGGLWKIRQNGRSTMVIWSSCYQPNVAIDQALVKSDFVLDIMKVVPAMRSIGYVNGKCGAVLAANSSVPGFSGQTTFVYNDPTSKYTVAFLTRYSRSYTYYTYYAQKCPLAAMKRVMESDPGSRCDVGTDCAQVLTSPNGLCSFRLQDDFNLVVYNAKDVPVWASNTVRAKVNDLSANKARLVLTKSCTLEAYQGNQKYWTSSIGRSGNYDSCVLMMQNDCNLALYATDQLIWSTNTAGTAMKEKWW